MTEPEHPADLRVVGVSLDCADPVELALALGARLADPQPDRRWRVLLDPAGHPFCITTVVPPDVVATT